jgi:D-sedoheptulose 7-phosphate isomerase
MSVSLNSDSVFEHAIAEHLSVIERRGEQPVLQRIATQMAQAVLAGNKILWCGNGGSAADSQHLAAEFVGRFRRERRGLPSIALTTDTSVLTSLSNDFFGYEKVFSKQVEALCAKGDVLVGISTSGKSRNVCLALKTAHDLGAFTVAFTGEDGGAIAEIADPVLRIPSKDTAGIQEGHILCGHLLCDWVDLSVCESQKEEKGIATR